MLENVITREAAIGRVRQRLEMNDCGDKSLCQFAAERGILCAGFRRYSDERLRETYHHLLRRDPFLSRVALERAANRWQLARQRDLGVSLSCDAQQVCFETCGGWNDFTNMQLAQFCGELLGEAVTVVGERTLAVI
ncbi:MAG TPA: hypothetical protein VGS96_08040 [Thermoanaerobaculia bacterium]|jgi:hypothetical protein|nr:hypothetical protein [Thermoanaerobaculia bacterium]